MIFYVLQFKAMMLLYRRSKLVSNGLKAIIHENLGVDSAQTIFLYLANYLQWVHQVRK